MRSNVDEQQSSLSIAFPNLFMFARRIIDVRGEDIGQCPFPFWSRPGMDCSIPVFEINLKLIANLSVFGPA
jgi:hypothetical protein